MTAAVTSRRLGGSRGTQRRRSKGAAFVVAGVVVAAGIAGATYVSSAYFTDTQTVASNSVTTTTVEMNVNNAGANTDLLAINRVGLVPAQTADLDALALATAFDVKNSGTGRFTYTARILTPTFTKRDGTALPGTTDSTHLSATDAAAKVRFQFGTVSGGTTNWNGAVQTLSTATGDVLTQTTPIAASAVEQYKVRFWLDEAGQALDNKAQDLKVAFDLRFDATQALS